MKLLPEQRFWPKVNFNGPIPEHAPELGPCWEWTAAVSRPDGYGRFGVEPRKIVLAHRWIYELTYGPIDDDLQVDHLCRNRACVNMVRHLEAVTPAENTRRIAYRPPPKLRCIRGHGFVEGNVRIDTTGRRHCLACDEINRQRRTRERAARRVARFGFDPGPLSRAHLGSPT